MIFKNKIQSLFFIDRDTDINDLADRILKQKAIEIKEFLEDQRIRLEEKDAGEYFTVEDTLKLKEGELERMNRFFRGAVVPYYIRQKYNIWAKTIPSKTIIYGADEIKRLVGFMKYNHDGRITKETNSLTTFLRVKDLNEFLKMVEAVCFDDNYFIFPDSKHFKDLEKNKGRGSAQRQVFKELHEKVKNKHYKREITD